MLSPVYFGFGTRTQLAGEANVNIAFPAALRCIMCSFVGIIPRGGAASGERGYLEAGDTAAGSHGKSAACVRGRSRERKGHEARLLYFD